jgi:addiction module HigA family antidote
MLPEKGWRFVSARSGPPPGKHLAEELKELSISAAELARQIDVPVNRVTGIINAQRAITADTALQRRIHHPLRACWFFRRRLIHRGGFLPGVYRRGRWGGRGCGYGSGNRRRDK